MKRQQILITGVLMLVGAVLAAWVMTLVIRAGPADGPSLGSERKSPLLSRPCHYTAVGDVAIVCYWFRTEEGFKLPLVVFRPHRKLDDAPLVYFAGGPGEERNTAERALEFWNYWYIDTIPGRDFILFDYRGAEDGSPAWDCHPYTEVSRLGMHLKQDIRAGYDRSGPVLHDCFAQWDTFLRGQLQGDYQPGETIGLFSSSYNARDAIDIVDALGYGKWYALAASYGTRAALVAATKDTELEKLILDAPYPPGFGGVVDSTRVWIESLDRFWQGCAAGHICKPGDASLSPETLFWKAMERLEAEPVIVTVDNWHATGSQPLLIDDVRLLLAISGALYSGESRARIMPTIEAAVHDEPMEPYLFEHLYNYAFDPDFNSMLYFATECNDNDLLDEKRFSKILDRAGRLRHYLQWDWQFDICRGDYFVSEPMPLLEPITAQVLVASGEYDPVTPPEYGEHLMNFLPNGQHIVLPQGAHAEFIHDACGRDLIARFLDDSPDGSGRSAFNACLKQNRSP